MKHTIVITEQPALTGTQCTPDGAICGNGDLAAVLGNSGKGMRIFLGKSDLWCADEDAYESGIRPLGYVDVDIPAALYNKVYRAEQRMDEGKTVCIFRDGYSYIKVELEVAPFSNILLISMEWSKNFKDPAPLLTLSEPNGCKVTPFEYADIKGAYTDYVGEDYVFESHVKTGIRKISQGETSAVYAVMAVSSVDSADYRVSGLEMLENMDSAVAAKLQAEHRDYWNGFYTASSVEFSDKELENDWYSSQYLLACGRGKPMFPPGLFANFVTVKRPDRSGGYRLNYSYEAPFYGAVSSNHPELTDYYADPLYAAIGEGRANANGYLGCRGIYYPSVLGPRGLVPEKDLITPERMFLGQKIYASYAAVVMIMRWKGTRDEKYASEVLYPYLAQLGEFWDTYLKQEKGRYVVYGDSVCEIPYYDKDFKYSSSKVKKQLRTKNSILSLGIVRMVYSALIDLAGVIPEAGQNKEHWQEILNNLSRYPVRRGRFAYSAKGVKKMKSGTVGIQHIYPLGQVGSDRKSLKISRKTIKKLAAWKDVSGTNSLYPAAAKVGVPAEEILKHYRANKKDYMMPNKLYNHAGGCFENVSLAAAMLNEMMLSGSDGVIKVFPNWDRAVDCEFKNLRVDGAFLVSAKIENGYIVYVKIYSEKGSALTVANPFTNKAYGGCNGTISGDTAACSGQYLEIDLPAGGEVIFTPAVTPKVKISKKDKKAAKKRAKKAKKAQKRAAKAVKTEAKDDKFYAKYDAKKAKKHAKKAAKKERRINKKYAKFDKKTAKRRAKRR